MEGDEKEIHSVYNLHVNGGVFNLGHRNEITRKALVEAVEEVDIGLFLFFHFILFSFYFSFLFSFFKFQPFFLSPNQPPFFYPLFFLFQEITISHLNGEQD